MRLTLKGMKNGWGDVGKCELGLISYFNGLDISNPSTEETLIKQNRPHYRYSVCFVPPKRKREIEVSFDFNEQGDCTGFKYWGGKRSKKLTREWEDILSNWLITNGYAEK